LERLGDPDQGAGSVERPPFAPSYSQESSPLSFLAQPGAAIPADLPHGDATQEQANPTPTRDVRY
jgi:hypothetical protein